MQQGDQTTNFGISLHCPGKKGNTSSSSWAICRMRFSTWSLQQARMLATALIQHVHRADVSNSMKG